MLPIERQQRIKALMKDHTSIKISELSKQLAVSEMTIHRDLKPLIEQGLLVKTFGGVTCAQSLNSSQPEDHTCVYCRTSIHRKTAYQLILVDQTSEMTCCAHCGLLRHQQLGESVVQAISYDFLKQTTISAPLAWYVLDTTLDIGCCHPQVLMFEWEKHAHQFVKGFGGEVYAFNDAIEIVFDKMNGSGESCHQSPS